MPKFLEKIYFDPEHPENHTAKMSNVRGNTLKILSDKGWKHEMADTAIDRMNMRANTELEMYADDEGDHRADHYFDTVNEERVVKRQRQTARNMILSNS